MYYMQINLLRLLFVTFIYVIMCGCAATKEINLDYPIVVSKIRNILGVNEGENKILQWNSVSCNYLKENLPQTPYNIYEISCGEGKKIFSIEVYYNIIAHGPEKVDIIISRTDKHSTQLTIDYSIRIYAIVYYLPIIYWNPGLFREREILNTVMQLLKLNSPEFFYQGK